MLDLIKALRPHQWAKGIFILLPLIFGQKLMNETALVRTFWMLIVFNLSASAMYLINDILDVDEDRNHPEKSKRPLAAGRVSLTQVITTAVILLAIAVPAAFLLDQRAGALIVFYLGVNYLYMRYLKNAVIIDVFFIGIFFYLRILAGAIASDVVLSNWIIMCTTLLALFLGFNKRKYDLEVSKTSRAVFTKYNSYFIDRMISMIGTSLVISYSLYVMDPATIARFSSNNLIYTVPFVYYGIFRYIYLIDTKWFGGDPAKILIGDYKIQLTMVLWLIVCVGVIYFKI